LESVTTREATEILESRGWEVEWELREPLNDEGIGEATLIEELPPSAVLVRAVTIEPALVRFILVIGPNADDERRAWGTPSETKPRSTWEPWAPPCD
jgi:hypothetical protein